MKIEFDLATIRKDFPVLERRVHDQHLVYLDNAATSLKPWPVIRALERYFTHDTANIHRGVHFLSEEGTRRYEETRQSVCSFIHAASTEEIIFTKGTTESINLVAHSWGTNFLKADDLVLLSTLEHHSNIVPWQLAVEKIGAKIVEVPITHEGEIDLPAYRAILKQHGPKVKMVSITQVSNGIGTVTPIKEMIDLAHEVGALFLVDGAQAISHIPVDVQTLNCDFYVFSAHKALGPTAFGVLYGKKALLEKMPPYQGGGDMIDVVTFAKTTYNDLPHKFEAGTPPIAEGIAFKAALEYLQEIGLGKIAAYEHALVEYALEKLRKIPKVNILGNPKERSGLVSFTVQGAHAHDLGTLLDQQGIAVRTGHHCNQPLMQFYKIPGTVRASFAFYNSTEDIDRFIRALVKAQELL
ncbi:MAG: cysteine sulfinate desulfinase [Bdellovibrionales bacterium GWA2_49_15]|nr:MAG: cysteine sulfinate desulfinase [Bdellovibrionales bacterium GWA2_49_15]